jgi:hypothetical protein
LFSTSKCWPSREKTPAAACKLIEYPAIGPPA